MCKCNDSSTCTCTNTLISLDMFKDSYQHTCTLCVKQLCKYVKKCVQIDTCKDPNQPVCMQRTLSTCRHRKTLTLLHMCKDCMNLDREFNPSLAEHVMPCLNKQCRSRSGSALFVIKYVNFYQKHGSSNLIGWKLEVGVAS